MYIIYRSVHPFITSFKLYLLHPHWRNAISIDSIQSMTSTAQRGVCCTQKKSYQSTNMKNILKHRGYWVIYVQLALTFED
jgi:hypothetical protein